MYVQRFGMIQKLLRSMTASLRSPIYDIKPQQVLSSANFIVAVQAACCERKFGNVEICATILQKNWTLARVFRIGTSG